MCVNKTQNTTGGVGKNYHAQMTIETAVGEQHRNTAERRNISKRLHIRIETAHWTFVVYFFGKEKKQTVVLKE